MSSAASNVTAELDRYVDAAFAGLDQVTRHVVYKLLLFIESVARPVYVALIVLGVFLYSTHISRRMGKDLVKGGVIIAILSEVLPRAITFIHAS